MYYIGSCFIVFYFYSRWKNTAPLFIVESVTDEYRRLYHKELTENPVEKIALVAHDSDGEVFLDEVVAEVGTQCPSVGEAARLNDERSATHQLRAIQSQLSSLKASILSLQERVVSLESSLAHRLTGVQRNLKRLVDAPGRRIRPPEGVFFVDDGVRIETSLSSLPRTLYDL